MFTISIIITNFILTRAMKGKREAKQRPVRLPSTQVEHDLTFLVKLTTPYVSAVKQINRKLKRIHRKRTTNYQLVKFFTVKGMGKAMATVALLLQEFGTKKVEVFTGTEEVVDTVKADTEGADDEYKLRKVSYIELRVWI